MCYITIFPVEATTAPSFPFLSDLGGPCRRRNDCRDRNAICQSGRCACGLEYFPRDNRCCKSCAVTYCVNRLTTHSIQVNLSGNIIELVI